MIQERNFASSSSSISIRNVVLASFSLAVIGILKRRGRACAAKVAALARKMVKSGPMVDIDTRSEEAKQIVTTSMNLASELPFSDTHDAKPLACQVGGISETKHPVLEMAPCYVLKPLHVDHRGYREIAFYESIRSAISRDNYNIATEITGPRNVEHAFPVGAFDRVVRRVARMLGDAVVNQYEQEIHRCHLQWKRELQLLRSLSTFTAKYYGVVGPRDRNPRICNHHIVLHDMTARFRKPCVIDIKMGRQTYEPDATEEKKRREYVKYPQQKDFGFRIVGMRVYDPGDATADPGGFRFFPKDFGRSLTCMGSLVEAFRCFFASNLNHRSMLAAATREGELDTIDNSSILNRDIELRVQAISILIAELDRLDAWFADNDCLRFYSSSILMVYEGEYSNNGGASSMAALKMIDFGHIRRDLANDDGYRLGLHNLSHLFRRLLNEGLVHATR